MERWMWQQDAASLSGTDGRSGQPPLWPLPSDGSTRLLTGCVARMAARFADNRHEPARDVSNVLLAVTTNISKSGSAGATPRHCLGVDRVALLFYAVGIRGPPAAIH